MFFTRVSDLDRHIYTQQAKSIVFSLLVLVIYGSTLPIMKWTLYFTVSAPTAESFGSTLVYYWWAVTGVACIVTVVRCEQYVRKCRLDTAAHVREERAHRLFDDVCRRSGLSYRPALLLDPGPGFSAVAANSFFSGSYVGISPTMLQLPDLPLQGVLAHEVGHLKNRDHLKNIFDAVMAFSFMIHSWVIAGALAWYVVADMVGNPPEEGLSTFLLFMLITLFVADILSGLARQAKSRAEEFLADASCFTNGGPELARAAAMGIMAIRVHKELTTILSHNAAAGRHEGGLVSKIGILLRSHPPTEDRVAFLTRQW